MDENIEEKFAVDAMQKSAIIYRDDGARFVYVCYHCGCMFIEISITLEHIEAHFRVANVMVDQLVDDVTEVKAEDEQGDSFAVSSDQIKVAHFDEIEEINFMTSTAVPTSHYNERIPKRCIDREELQEDKKKKVKTKTIASSKESSTAVRRKRKRKLEFPYRCHKCPQRCNIVSALNIHLKTHVDDSLLQTFKCRECDEYFTNAAALRVHVIGVHLKRASVECAVCSEKFRTTQSKKSQSKKFVEHMQQHSCGLDIKLTKGSTRDYTKYEKIESFSEEQFSCNLCPKRFYIESNLDAHWASIHSKPHTHECPECQATFNSPISYYAHQLEHQRTGPHITETDDDVLHKNLIALVDERIIYEADSEQKYRCLVCDHTTNERHDIRQHVRRIHVYKMFPAPLKPKEQFICDICGVKCKSKYNMTGHMEIHTNSSKPHACSVCGKAFRHKLELTIHERRHSGVKPYQCDECGKTFPSNSSMTAHKYTHQNNSYPCKICGKIFRSPARHTAHMHIHRVDRPFKCSLCLKTFKAKIYLQKHQETHSDRKHPCRYCASEFNTGDRLRQHYRHRHKDEWKALHPNSKC